MKRFFKNHWKTLLVVVIAIVLIFVVIRLAGHFAGNNTTNNVTSLIQTNNTGKTGIVTIDGQKIGVFDNTADAKSNTIGIDAGTKQLVVKGKNANVSTPEHGIISKISESDYELNLNVSDGSNVMFTVKIGGDGSLIGQQLNNNVETYYFVLNVSNPNSTASVTSPITSNVPTGVIHFGDSTFQIYGSEADAQAAVNGKQNQFTIPTSMARNLTLTAEPQEGTARILVSVCMVDNNDEIGKEVRLNNDSNWTGTLDLSSYAGHQVTIVMKAENAMALSNGYTYCSFFVPNFEKEPEEQIQPVAP